MRKNSSVAEILTIFMIFLSCANSFKIIRNEMDLERYNFVRMGFSSSDIEYLMGNGEMGGLADTRGLGFKRLWFADVWKNSEERMDLYGPLFACSQFRNLDYSKADFKSELNIRNSICTTEVNFSKEYGYTTKIFFSKEKRHLLVIGIRNRSKKVTNWSIRIPFDGFDIKRVDRNMIHGTGNVKQTYTKMSWTLKANREIFLHGDSLSFTLAPEEEGVFAYSVTTHFDSEDYDELSIRTVDIKLNLDDLVKSQREAWDDQWRRIASVIIPDGEYARLFYRSIYTVYATAGSDKFLAGELQFSIPDPDWHMHHFTYGHGVWAIWDFAYLGDSQKSLKSLKWMYKPEALKKNVKILFPQGRVHVVYRGEDRGAHTYIKKYNPEAMAFPHESTAEGYNITYAGTAHWDWQRHVDAFASATFHLVDRYYPELNLTEKYTWPVLKGTAEMWRSLLKWDDEKKYYYLPPLLSVSENILERSVLDGVLTARWNLNMAASYAERLGKDLELARLWRKISDNIYIPQNDSLYLEYLNDTQKRKGGGYFGIRAPIYLGFPLFESIKTLDRKKAVRTLDKTWERDNSGSGMITFIMNWFALTEALFGSGDLAFEMSNLCTGYLDPSKTAMYEVVYKERDGKVRRVNPYFLTGYSSFILVPITMMLQSYDHTIRIFPSLPSVWKDVEFYDLPVEGGFRVSAILKNGKFVSAEIKRQGRLVMRLRENSPVEIIEEDGTFSLREVK